MGVQIQMELRLSPTIVALAMLFELRINGGSLHKQGPLPDRAVSVAELSIVSPEFRPRNSPAGNRSSLFFRIAYGSAFFKKSSKFFFILSLAFPNNDNFPSHSSQLSLIPLIALYCPLEFRQPIIITSRGRACTFAAPVPVPETSMNKYNCSIFRQNNVRISREVCSIQSETITQVMNQRTNSDFRACVRRSDAPHYLAALTF